MVFYNPCTPGCWRLLATIIGESYLEDISGLYTGSLTGLKLLSEKASGFTIREIGCTLLGTPRAAWTRVYLEWRPYEVAHDFIASRKK